MSAIVRLIVGLTAVAASTPTLARAATVACQRGRKIVLRLDSCRAKEARVPIDADRLGGRTPSEIQGAILGAITPPIPPIASGPAQMIIDRP